jgi:hypothetical protein
MDAVVVFASLFLGLTTGVHTVELEVAAPVAAVEILVDQRQVAVIDQAPWQVEYDFGARLTPRELIAVARDRHGAVLGRARQLVNLPRSELEATIHLQRDQQGQPVSAKVIWESVVFDEAQAFRAYFDGLPLPGSTAEQIALPAHDPAAVHLLAVEIELAESHTARAEVSFGGFYGAEINMDLTAVPIVIQEAVAEPSVESMSGCFQVRGQTRLVVAVEKGNATLHVVQDQLSRHLLRDRLRRYDRVQAAAKGKSLRRYTASRDRSMSRAVAPPKRSDQGFDRVCFVHPEALHKSAEEESELVFAVSESFQLIDDGLPWLLSQRPGMLLVKQSQSLSDAVAVAGVRAAAGRSRRAVVLVLSEQPVDASRHSARMARSYLQSINVPLLVWVASDQPAIKSPWGMARGVADVEALMAAADDVHEQLAAQWIVWLDGAHLPTEIKLTEKARGIRLAGLPVG